MNIQIANRLVELRKSHGLSQEALAEQLGISRQAVSKWERAEASPDTENLMTLCSLYGVTMDSILYPDRKPEEPKVEPKKEEKKQKRLKVPKLHLPKTPLQKAGMHILKFPFPIFVIALYVGLGFGFKLWHPGWLLFLLLPIYYHLGGAFCVRRKKALLLALPVPEVVISIYLTVAVFTKNWVQTLLILLVIPLYYWLVACFYHDEESKKS